MTKTGDCPKRFLQAFNRLVASKNSTADDVKQETFWEDLLALPIEAVERAAEQLRHGASPYLPSSGEWRTLATTLARRLHADAAEQEVRLLTAPHTVPEDEEEEIRQARGTFLDQIEAMGITVDRAAWERLPIKIPTYACPRCQDIGWVSTTIPPGWPKTYNPPVTHCECFETNPVLQRQRALSGAVPTPAAE
jgi:hypothetical protein